MLRARGVESECRSASNEAERRTLARGKTEYFVSKIRTKFSYDLILTELVYIISTMNIPIIMIIFHFRSCHGEEKKGIVEGSARGKGQL